MIDLQFKNEDMKVKIHRSQLRVTAMIDGSTQSLCQGCFEGMMILAPFKSKVAVTLDYRFTERNHLDVPSSITDYLDAQTLKVFKVNVTDIKEERKNLLINLNSLSGGIKKIYANRVIQPFSRDKYEF